MSTLVANNVEDIDDDVYAEPTIKECSSLSTVHDDLKPIFKYYKQRRPPPKYDEVVDFSTTCDDKVSSANIKIGDFPKDEVFKYLKPVSQWKVSKHVDYIDFLHIENPFTVEGQQYWIKRCLIDLPSLPCRNNLNEYPTNMWKDHCDSKLKDLKEKSLMERLRWVTLGYHHNWNTKIYTKTEHDPIPEDLSVMTQFIASTIGYPNYNSEATVVNYYHDDSRLSCHVDQSEVDHSSPLISYSFGLTAVFLIAGLERNTRAQPIFIRSGDIVIMAGASRLAYHGVPRILDNNGEGSEVRLRYESRDHNEDECDWSLCQKYILNNRINFNVRQVYPNKH